MDKDLYYLKEQMINIERNLAHKFIILAAGRGKKSATFHCFVIPYKIFYFTLLCFKYPSFLRQNVQIIYGYTVICSTVKWN